VSFLWNTETSLDERVLRYTAGEDHALDARLVRYDVAASIAHAEMLNEAQLLEAADLSALVSALRALGAEHAQGSWHIALADEDGQTALEKRLTERLGERAGRIHLGRSRNDQVLAALRLYLLDAIRDLRARAESVALALDEISKRQGAVVLPGYTHMQQAMPSSVALWAAGYAAQVRDDAEALAAVERRVSQNPLGSAAGYGTPGLPIDREATRRKLGFAITQAPVSAVQLSRGKAEAQLLFEITLLMQGLGRLASDVLLFYTQEFGFVSIDAAFTTGSSIMPQKRNPDVFELIRGRAVTAQACLDEVLGLTAKLPSGYQRDLQLLKAPLFRGIDVAFETLAILPAALAALKFHPERIRLDDTIHAAEEANRLVVSAGIPFREAYRRVRAKLKR
jgi:argininosuccinate lyase